MKLPFRAEYSMTTGLSQCMRDELEVFHPDIVHIATPDVVAPQVVTWVQWAAFYVGCTLHPPYFTAVLGFPVLIVSCGTPPLGHAP